MSNTIDLPKISIVTACLDNLDHLEDAILSVRCQNYPDVEHIVVHAGFRNGSTGWSRSYPHVRWLFRPGLGLAEAINTGLHTATGRLIGRLDWDEYYLPGALSAVAESAAARPDSDFFYGDCFVVDGGNRLRRAHTSHRFNYRMLLYHGCYMATAAAFFRRTVVENGFLLDPDYREVHDFEFFVRSAAAGKTFQYIDRFLGATRREKSPPFFHDTPGRRERLRVQRKWSPIAAWDMDYDVFGKLYQGKRAWLKLCDGTYFKERKAMRLAGRETAWFRDDTALEACGRLMKLGPQKTVIRTRSASAGQ